jgi:DNA polymerase I-like protein with 3'-5' exonuclease and polymerase domains
MPVASLLAQMERTGVVVSTAHQDEVRVALSARIHDIELQIFATAGGAPFNVASPEQVAHFLYETLALPAPAQTSKKGKHHSTSEEDLQRIASLHPAVGLILDYRALAKLLSTYVDGLRSFICKESEPLHRELHDQEDSLLEPTFSNEDAADAFSVLMGQARTTALEARLSASLQHRIHANWQQTVVRTGRLSCTKPNLQNIPNSQDTAGLHINMRSAFQASAGYVLRCKMPHRVVPWAHRFFYLC